jgi:hypothetical protein
VGVLVTVALYWYVNAQHREGDITAASNALQDAGIAAGYLASDADTASVQSYVLALEATDIFLISDSAHRMPWMTKRLLRSNLQLDAAGELWQFAAHGVTQPALEDAPDVDSAVKAFPALRALVKVVDGDRVLDNRGNRAVAVLDALAREEIAAAGKELDERTGSTP